jgi:hypothetical protein
MNRQFGSTATPWQTAPTTSSFERSTVNAECGDHGTSEIIALNSESGQTLRFSGGSKDKVLKDSMLKASCVNDGLQVYYPLTSSPPKRDSNLLKSAPFCIADQSPFYLRSTKPRQPIQRLLMSSLLAGYSSDNLELEALAAEIPDEINFNQAIFPGKQTVRLKKEAAKIPANETVDAEDLAASAQVREPANNLLISKQRTAVSFDAGKTSAKVSYAESTTSRAYKAGDALQIGRMGNSPPRNAEISNTQNYSSLAVIDTNSMRSKFQAANIEFSKSISPDGQRTQIKTAPDFSSLTEIWTPTRGGAYIYNSVYRDELNRVRYEESVTENGLRTIVQTGYCDSEDKKSPFVAYKVKIKPDGSREVLA